MLDNQILNGVVDMSSDEPHITMICPLCGTAWMKKVELDKPLVSPCNCKIQYSMTGTVDQVEVEIKLNREQTKLYNAKFW